MAYIEMQHCYKHYTSGETEIFANRDVSFEIEKGELVIILGASGAGKSTVLNILGGMDTNDEGQVLIDGVDIAKLNAHQRTNYRRDDVGFVFQFYNLVPNLTAKENVELASEIVSDALDPEAVLREVGLGNRLHNFPAQLSGGEQQRVAIARAVAKNPKNPSTRQVQAVSRDMMALAAVKAVSQNASMISLFNSVAKSLDTTMMILVVVSILLAIVILYNLTNINVAERIRELSTIKVLGFHNKEVTLYIYRETILLSIIGILMGLVGGYYLHQFLIAMIAPDAILFYPKVGLGVFLFPVGGLILLLVLLGIYVDHYLRKVDMLEALKSVD